MATDARAMLAEGIKDKSDEEIISLIQTTLGSVAQGLDTIFEGMAAALDPAKAQDCVVCYEIKEGDTAHAYTMTVKDKTATVSKGLVDDARVTITQSAPDFLRLVSGQLDGMQAFMQGKLKLKGDMMFAAQVPNMFQQ